MKATENGSSYYHFPQHPKLRQVPDCSCVSISTLGGKLVPPGVICNDPKSLLLNCEDILSSRCSFSPSTKLIFPPVHSYPPMFLTLTQSIFVHYGNQFCFIHFQLLPLAWDVTIKLYFCKGDQVLIIRIIQPIAFHLYENYRNTATGVLFLRLTSCLTINSVSNLDPGFSMVKGTEVKSAEDRLLKQVPINSPFYILSTQG